MYYATIRRRQLLVAVRVKVSIVTSSSWSSGYRSKHSCRIMRQTTKNYLTNRYIVLIGQAEKNPRASKTEDIYQ